MESIQNDILQDVLSGNCSPTESVSDKHWDESETSTMSTQNTFFARLNILIVLIYFTDIFILSIHLGLNVLITLADLNFKLS